MNELLGQQLGDYQLTRLVAQEVFIDRYLGEHVRTRASAELLVFHARVDGKNANDFQREAQLLIQLVHPGLTRLFDFNILNNQAFLVQEVRPTSTLRQLYPPGAQLPISVVVDYLKQIGNAVQYAHEHSLIHGELRSEYLYLQPDRHTLLLGNLGIMHLAQAITSINMNVIGNNPYLAPEQVHGLTDPKSDQYALAALAYEWLSGELPVQEAGNPAGGELRLLRTLAQKTPTLPVQAVQVLQSALSFAPEQRFGSVRAFINALEQAAKSIQGQAVLTPLQPSAAAGQAVVAPLPLSPAPLQPVLTPLLSSAVPAAPGYPAPGTYPQPAPVRPGPTRRNLLIGLIAGGAGLIAAGTGAALLVKARLDASSQPQQPTLRYAYKIGDSGGVPFWSPDSSRLAIFVDGLDSQRFEVWDVADQGHRVHYDSPIRTTSLSQGEKWDIGWVNNKLQLAWITQLDNSFHLVDIASQQESTLTIGTGRDNDIGTVNWSPDGTTIALGLAYGGLSLWNVAQKRERGRFSAGYNVRWAPDNRRLLTWATDGKLTVWQVPSGPTVATYTKHAEQHPRVPGNWLSGVTVKVAQWSPNGQYIASQATGFEDGKPPDNIIHIWNASTGSEVAQYTGHKEKGFTDLAWSPDSTMVATVDQDGIIHVWSASTGQQLFLHNDSAHTVLAWAPKGQRVASSGTSDDFSGRVFEVWDATTGKNVVTYTEANAYNQANFISWSPDRQYIVTVTYDEVQVWQGGW